MMAADLSHIITGDLALSSGGDLATVSGLDLSKQRVLRRLLTNPGDYIWRPTYGAGLPAQVGSTTSAARLQALILSQMLMEPSVAPSPAPVITVTTGAVSMTVAIVYVEAASGQTQSLTFSVSP